VKLRKGECKMCFSSVLPLVMRRYVCDNIFVFDDGVVRFVNLLAPKFYIEILAHPVCKM
jgi:hypothetical protein